MDWQPVFSAFVQIFLVGLITAFAPAAIRYLKAKADNLTDEWQTELDWLKEIADIAVRAAEQAELGLLIDDKREYAFGVARTFLFDKDVSTRLVYELELSYIESVKNQNKKKFENNKLLSALKPDVRSVVNGFISSAIFTLITG